MRKFQKSEETESLTGIILMTGLAVIVFGLFYSDPNILFYSIPIIFALIIAVSRGKKDIDESVKSIGITGVNMKESIGLGISGGILVFIIGSFLIELSPGNIVSIVPSFTLTKLETAAVIPASFFLGSNIAMQWLVVAPSEEIGYRFLAPYIFNTFLHSVPIAMILGIFVWVFIHIPTFMMQSASMGMYLVLILLGGVSAYLIYQTGGLIASWITHSIFNTLVLLFSGGVVTTFVYIILIGIGSVLIAYYVFGGDKNAKSKKRSKFNL